MNVFPVLATTHDPNATRDLAAAVATVVAPGDLIVLVGGLGAGKTCFVQGFAAALGATERVTSPTFALVHAYDGPRVLLHADLYRLASEHEVLDLGLDEALADGAIAIVEWGDVAGELLSPDRLTVLIDAEGEAEDDRAFAFITKGRAWCDRRNALGDATEEWR